VLGYAGSENRDCDMVTNNINEQLQSFVLGTNKQRGDFENIFHELKKQFKGGSQD
jgi:hypothetical protein